MRPIAWPVRHGVPSSECAPDMRTPPRMPEPLEGPVRPQSRGIGRSGIVAVIALIAGFVLVPALAQATPAAPRPYTATAGGLATVARTLSRSTGLAGTAWLVDPRSRTVVVIADRTVRGARLDRLQAATRPYGNTVRVQRVAGTLGLRVSGGDP